MSYTSRTASSIRLYLGVTSLSILVVLCLVSFHSWQRKLGSEMDNEFSSFQGQAGKMRELHSIDSSSLMATYDVNKTFFRSTFSSTGQERPSDDELKPNQDDLPDDLLPKISPFLKMHLADQPTQANLLSKEMKQSGEVIKEAQRVHFNVLEDILKGYKYAMLFDIAAFENKGDSCISVGEFYFIQRMHLELLYYCSTESCTDENLEKAKNISERYSPKNLVILGHGGGNLVGYFSHDVIRFKLLKHFSKFQIVVLTQGVWMNDRYNHLKSTIRHYSGNPRLTFVLRDAVSYNTAKKHYAKPTRLLLAPDMAFQIGPVPRFLSPVFDILWLRRGDVESARYDVKLDIPNNLRVHISDWMQWETPLAGNNLEQAFYMAANGFFFLQRGRVIITDRLHGHIMSTLLNIPHVLLDNQDKKLSNYHNTWTKSLENTVITDNPKEALRLAIKLLKKYSNTLPPLVPFIDLDENFKRVIHKKPMMSYP